MRPHKWMGKRKMREKYKEKWRSYRIKFFMKLLNPQERRNPRKKKTRKKMQMNCLNGVGVFCRSLLETSLVLSLRLRNLKNGMIQMLLIDLVQLWLVQELMVCLSHQHHNQNQFISLLNDLYVFCVLLVVSPSLVSRKTFLLFHTRNSFRIIFKSIFSSSNLYSSFSFMKKIKNRFQILLQILDAKITRNVEPFQPSFLSSIKHLPLQEQRQKSPRRDDQQLRRSLLTLGTDKTKQMHEDVAGLERCPTIILQTGTEIKIRKL